MGLKIVACQTKRKNSSYHNFEDMLRLIDISKKEYNPDIICFPETFPFGFDTIQQLERRNLEEQIIKMSKEQKLNLVYGRISEEKDLLYKSAIIINNGEISRYDKRTRFGDEKYAFGSSSSGPLVLDINGYKIGFAICYDLLFPEVIREIVFNGANLVICQSSVPKKMEDVWKSIVLTRTYENHVPIVNVTDINEKHKTIGMTLITEPHFNVKSVANTREKEELVYSELELEKFTKRRFKVSPNEKGSELFKKGEFGPFIMDLDQEILENIYKSFSIKKSNGK